MRKVPAEASAGMTVPVGMVAPAGMTVPVIVAGLADVIAVIMGVVVVRQGRRGYPVLPDLPAHRACPGLLDHAG